MRWGVLIALFFAPLPYPAQDTTQSHGAQIQKLIQAARYREAETAARTLLNATEAASGPNSLDTASALNLLQKTLLPQRRESDPELTQIITRALRIREQALGPEAGPTLELLIDLAGVQRTNFDQAGALATYTRVLSARERTLGPEHALTGTAANELGITLFYAGDYAAAKPYIERALGIARKTGNQWSEAQGLTALGFLLNDTGDTTAALDCLKQALALREKLSGPEGRYTVAAINNLAIIYAGREEWGEALRLYERANAIREKILASTHPDVAIGYNNLSAALIGLGRYAEAVQALERALMIREKTLGVSHPLFATTLMRLAEVLFGLREFSRARDLNEQALATAEKSLGPEHPDVAHMLVQQALTLAALGEQERPFDLALRASRVQRERVRLSVETMPERNALLYSRLGLTRPDALTSVYLLHPNSRPAEVWDAWIRARAMVLDEIAARQRLGSLTGELSTQRNELAATRQKLARLTVKGNDGADYPARLLQARNAKEQAERELAAANSTMRQHLHLTQAGYREIAAALPPGAALVAYARFERFNGKDPKTRPEMVAFVLTHSSAAPEIIPLGSAAAIESAVAEWRAQIVKEATAPGVGGLRGETAMRAAGLELRRRIWDPIAKNLKGSARVFLVPDGVLHLVNFAALPAGPKRFLVDTGPTLHYLTAERDLLEMLHPAQGTGLLAIGNPAFDMRGNQAVAARKRGLEPGCEDLRTLRFDPLPATARELDEIAALWSGPKISLRGAQASETNFKQQAPGKRIVHVATHGYFMPAKCTSGMAARAAIDENPLLQSGLVLAGANLRQSARPGEEDGILTAEEIAGLDLNGVEWVVLSGCDTGLGVVRAGEGVLGLRRAFQVAGAGTVIMSLWAVEDETARTWMKALYEQRFSKGKDTAECVQAADRTVLARLRAQGKSTHPFHWAAFIGAGSWR